MLSFTITGTPGRRKGFSCKNENCNSIIYFRKSLDKMCIFCPFKFLKMVLFRCGKYMSLSLATVINHRKQSLNKKNYQFHNFHMQLLYLQAAYSSSSSSPSPTSSWSLPPSLLLVHIMSSSVDLYRGHHRHLQYLHQHHYRIQT
jgi:hypothetical protein